MTRTTTDRLRFLFQIETTYFLAGFYFLIFLYVLSTVVAAINYSPSARLFPLLIGIPLLILLTTKLVLILFVSPRTDSTGPFSHVYNTLLESDSHQPNENQQKDEAHTLIWITIAFLLIWLIGFYFAGFIFITAFIYYNERSLLRALLTSTITVLGLIGLFEEILSAPTYQGFLFGLF